MKETELKPCPFCGGEADFITETTTIKCKQCGGAFIVTNPLINRLEVAQAWNSRSEQKEAEWIFKEEKDAFFCSLCDQEALLDANFIGLDYGIAELSDFCPHCGAKMKGGAE